MPNMRRWHREGCGLAALVMVVAATTAYAQNRAEEETRRVQWQKVDAIFAAMGVRAGAVVADIGAGDGFFTSRLSAAVGASGHVYAVDVDDDALGRLRRRLEGDAVRNVTIVKGSADDPKLPEGVLDAALIVNAYHEMEQYRAILAAVRRALKPAGRLVIVEPISDGKRNESREAQIKEHEIAPEFVLQEARAAGFRITGLEDPFVHRKGDVEWMMVLAPRETPITTTTPATEPTPSAAAEPTPENDPALRASLEQVLELLAAGGVTIVDVRDTASFEQEHIPGAISIPLDSIETSVERLGKLGKAIITYCS